MLWEADRLTVAPHVCMATDGVPHLCERQVGYGDGAAAQHLEARLAVERNEEVFTHQHCSANIGQAAEILQVTPHQNGSFALLPEGAMNSEDVDVDSGATWLVQGQGVLKQSGYRPKFVYVLVHAAFVLKRPMIRRMDAGRLTVVSLSWSQREPMIKATSRPSSNQPMDSSGHSVRK